MKFPFVRQRDTMQCGAACLAMICRYFGKKVSITDIEAFCHITSEGVSLKGIRDAASALGLNTLPLKITLDEVSKGPFPSILHWNQNHFVVLYGYDEKKERYFIADPGKGKYSVTSSDMTDRWASISGNKHKRGIALFFKPAQGFDDFKPEHGEKRSFKFLSGYLSEYRRYFFQIILGLLLGCILQLILPFLTQWIVDLGIRHNDVALIWLILLGELMIVLGRTATDFIRRWLLLHISMRINISLVSDFFIKLLKLPMSFFETKLMGDLLKRIDDHSRVQTFMTGQVLGIMFTIVSFIVFGIVLLIYNKIIFAIFLICSAVYTLWMIRFLKQRKKLDYEMFEQQAINQNRTYQFVTTMQEIKLQDCERRRRWEWEDTQADLFCVQMKTMKLQQIEEAGSVLINEIKNILITVFAATAVIEGELTLGAMLAIQYIVGQLSSPVIQLMQFVYSVQDVSISLERINEIHEVKCEWENGRNIRGFLKEKSIEIKRISFKYAPHAIKNTLEDVSFTIPAGKVTAIVGASGSGKSTLVKLMLGYYPVSSGDILIGGIDIRDYDIKWWRRHCGVVMQDGVIFSESIARNIAVDDSEIDVMRLENAATIACIHDYVMSLPLGYDTKVGRDGKGLSQGQKQRILIARAVYRNPDFIFLDEATNSLDAKNERVIVENLEKFYRGRTVVVVAHRLSTVKNADRIIVMNEGTVVETGTHSELIECRGIYFNLVKDQLELGN